MPDRQIQIGAGGGLWPPNWPMGLTMLRLLLLPVFLWLILADQGHAALPHRWWAIGIFAVMAATDKLDGYLARKLNQTSRIGAILDPVADKLLVACSIILLSFDWIATPRYQIPRVVVAAVYGSYLAIVAGTLALLALIGKVSISPRPLGKAGTVLQLTLVLLTLVAPTLQTLAADALRRVLVVLWWVVPILAALTCADYAVQGVQQLRPSRSPPSGPTEAASRDPERGTYNPN